MSKHGNNNAKHVLKAESSNLRWMADHIDGLAIRTDDNVNLISDDNILNLNELLMRLDKTRRELTTIIPKENHYESKISSIS